MGVLEKIKYFLKKPFRLPVVVITKLPYFGFIRKTKDYQNRVNFNLWFIQKVLNIGNNKDVYWPVHYTSKVNGAKRIIIGVDTCPGLMRGCYIQGGGGIIIGDYTQIAPNTHIVSANHDLHDTRKHIRKKVVIGKYCWIGGGAKILPGTVLGDHTVVGAGSVVTKSFPEGYCVIVGNPAVKIKSLEKSMFVEYKVKNRYYGYLKEKQFLKLKKTILNNINEAEIS
ncbi:MAG: acyltransferase [Bacteroidales bacterium]|nr:acyltransferase [Bacteroidales bacterium]